MIHVNIYLICTVVSMVGFPREYDDVVENGLALVETLANIQTLNSGTSKFNSKIK